MIVILIFKKNDCDSIMEWIGIILVSHDEMDVAVVGSIQFVSFQLLNWIRLLSRHHHLVDQIQEEH
jgi:hypothetical protein